MSPTMPANLRHETTADLEGLRDQLVGRLDKGFAIPVAKLTEALAEKWVELLHDYERVENELRWRGTRR